MAEMFEFELKLIDSVSRSATKAADAVKGVKTQAEKATKSLDFSKELHRTEEALKKIHFDPKGYRDLLKKQKEIAEHRRQIKKDVGGESFGEAFKAKLGFGRMVSASFMGDLFAEALIEGIKKPIEMFADGVKEAFKAIGEEQSLRAGYKLTLGGKEGNEAREDIERFSDKTAFSASQNQEQMLPLYRAGIKDQDARSTYAASLDLAAGQGKGADAGAVAAIVDQFAKIQQKGGISTKQLAGMGLGEKNAPAFFKDLGKQLHMSAAAAEKLAAKPGGVDPKILRNTIMTAVEKQQGGQLGTGAEVAGKSLQGRWNKLKAIPEEMFRKLVDNPALDKVGDAIERIIKKFDPKGPLAAKVFAELEKAFTKLADWIDRSFSEKNIDLFVKTVQGVPAVLDRIITSSEIIGTIWLAGKIMSGIKSASSALEGLSQQVAEGGGLRAGLGKMVGTANAAAAALGSVALAYHEITAAAEELGGWSRVGKDFKDWLNDDKPAIATDEVNENSPQWKKDRANGVSPQAPMVPDRPMVARGDTSKSVTIAPHIEIVGLSVAGKDEDPTHTAQKVAQEIHKHLVKHVERSVQESGG